MGRKADSCQTTKSKHDRSNRRQISGFIKISASAIQSPQSPQPPHPNLFLFLVLFGLLQIITCDLSELIGFRRIGRFKPVKEHNRTRDRYDQSSYSPHHQPADLLV